MRVNPSSLGFLVPVCFCAQSLLSPVQIGWAPASCSQRDVVPPDKDAGEGWWGRGVGVSCCLPRVPGLVLWAPGMDSWLAGSPACPFPYRGTVRLPPRSQSALSSALSSHSWSSLLSGSMGWLIQQASDTLNFTLHILFMWQLKCCRCHQQLQILALPLPFWHSAQRQKGSCYRSLIRRRPASLPGSPVRGRAFQQKGQRPARPSEQPRCAGSSSTRQQAEGMPAPASALLLLPPGPCPQQEG